MVKYRVTDIENFVAASNCRTIIEAASKLGITQPALSESIKRLEHDSGVQLFYRSRTGIQLTPSGRTFLTKAKKVIESLRELDEAENQQSVFAGKSIAIGCHSTVAQYVLPKALSYLAAHAPDYRVQLEHDLSRNIQLEVQRGHIDIGIVINPAEVPDIVLKKIGTDVVSVWSGKKDFDESTIICNPALFQTQHILRKWKNKPSRTIETDSLELICHLVQAGLGFGIIPRRAVRLSGCPLSEMESLPSYQDTIYMAYRPEFGANKAEELVCEALKISL